MGAGKTLVGSQAPAALDGTLGTADESSFQALGGQFIVLQQSPVLLRLDDLGPADALSKAQLLILQHCHAAGPDHFQRSQVERIQRRFHNVQGRKIFRQLPAANRLQIAEVGQIPEFRMRSLDINKPSNLLEGGEYFQPVRMESRVARAEGEIGVNLLESGEGMIQDRDGSLDDGAIAEALDVSGVDDIDALAGLWARAVADDAFAVDGLLLGRADADAGPVVLEQMLRTRFDAGGAVGVFALGVDFPRVRDGVVALHGRAFLLAHAVVEEIPASLSVRS